jgi:hypothetical protein
MDTDAERVLVFELMECLAKCFKWVLDCKPVVEREPIRLDLLLDWWRAGLRLNSS